METLLALLKMIAAVLLGVAVGHWFLQTVKENRARGVPWPKSYFSLPGIIVLLAILGLPLLLWLWG